MLKRCSRRWKAVLSCAPVLRSRGGARCLCAACRLTESGRRRADDAVTGPDRGRGYDAFVRFDGGDGRRLWRVGV